MRVFKPGRVNSSGPRAPRVVAARRVAEQLEQARARRRAQPGWRCGDEEYDCRPNSHSELLGGSAAGGGRSRAPRRRRAGAVRRRRVHQTIVHIDERTVSQRAQGPRTPAVDPHCRAGGSGASPAATTARFDGGAAKPSVAQARPR